MIRKMEKKCRRKSRDIMFQTTNLIHPLIDSVKTATCYVNFGGEQMWYNKNIVSQNMKVSNSLLKLFEM